MAIDTGDVPAERAQLRFEVAQVTDLLHPGVRLNLVVVDDRDDLAEPPVRRRHERFPELSFLEFAVPRQYENAPAVTRQAIGQRHPLRLRDPHPERPGIRLDERCLHVRMAWQSVDAPEL